MKRPITRLMQMVKITNDHWLWMGPVYQDGHGRFRVTSRREIRADRYVYSLFMGPLIGNLVNVCGEPACVSPEPEHRRPA